MSQAPCSRRKAELRKVNFRRASLRWERMAVR
jgi:hypothetical protein